MKKTKTAKQIKRKKRFVRALSIILAAIVAFVGVAAAITAVGLKINKTKASSFAPAGCAELELENTSSGCWNIYSDNGLKIMQLTDIHLGGGWMSINKDAMALNAVAAMITAEKPDLVIVTGDVAYPVFFQAGTFNNKSGAALFAELMESLGVYWTLTYGNHDTELYSYYSREALTKFYSSGAYPHCLLQSGPQEVDGEGNQVFNIVNSDGVITRSLILMDSHSYVDGDYFGIQWKYDNIHENQIEWYRSVLEDIKAKNTAAVSALSPEKAAEYAAPEQAAPTSLFLHIPLTEYKTAWDEYAGNGCENTADVKYNHGVAGEEGKIVFCGIHEDELFETMLACDSTDTVFCGHDHLNSFSLNYKGIDLSYGMSIDYLAYIGISKLGSQRGCTLINISPAGGIDYEKQSYYQEKYAPLYEKEAVTMQPLGG